MKYPKSSSNLVVFATSILCAALTVSGARAQQQQTAPPAAANDRYQGVSEPPPNDTIVTNDDTTTPPMPPAKPSPAVPVRAIAPPAAVMQPAASTAVPAPPVTAYAADTPARATNPDDYMITSTTSELQAESNQAGEPSNAALQTRPADPDAGIVSIIRSPDNQLAEGTDINVRLLQDLSTTQTADGARFKAQVTSNVYKDNRVVIPVGSELRGHVVHVSQGHRIGARATLRLRPEAVVLPDGTAYHLYAQLVEVNARGARVDDEGGILPSTHFTKDAIEYGAGAGTGAVVGAQVGGPPGALVGSLVGAGVVTTHLLIQPPKEVDVPQGSLLVFSLTEPMDLLPTRN